MLEKFNNYTIEKPLLKKVIGWFLVVLGFLALITPLTPGGILFFVGLEILGLRIIFTEKLKRFFGKKHTATPIQTIITEEKMAK